MISSHKIVFSQPTLLTASPLDMNNMNNSIGSLESDSSNERPAPRLRPYISTLLCGRSRTLSPTTGAFRRVEEGILYRMLREKGSTHEEAYTRQKICTQKACITRELSSGSSSLSTASEKILMSVEKQPEPFKGSPRFEEWDQVWHQDGPLFSNKHVHKPFKLWFYVPLKELVMNVRMYKASTCLNAWLLLC